MKTFLSTLIRTSLLTAAVFACATFASAQSAKIHIEGLDHLDGKALKSVSISLDKNTLGFASKVLSQANDPDERVVKELLSSIEEINVRSYEFANSGEYLTADVDGIRNQLKGPGWSRIVDARSRSLDDNAEVYVMMQNGKVLGITILAANPKELTVVNIVGSFDPAQLGDLDGELGIPRIELKRNAKTTP